MPPLALCFAPRLRSQIGDLRLVDGVATVGESSLRLLHEGTNAPPWREGTVECTHLTWG